MNDVLKKRGYSAVAQVLSGTLYEKRFVETRREPCGLSYALRGSGGASGMPNTSQGNPASRTR